MKYSDARPLIKSGDILGWTHKAGWFDSWYDFKINIVRLVTRSKYSHVGVAIVLAGRVFILESVTGGIRLEPLSKFLPCDWLTYKELDEAGIERAMGVCGEPYSQIEAMLGQFNDTDSTNGKWQCSEFVIWALQLNCLATPSAVVDCALSQDSNLRELHA